MRILDKNTDFYDYLQNIYLDKTLTFDRTKSFILTKDDMRDYIAHSREWRTLAVGDRRFILLQVCNMFWLFCAKVTKVNRDQCLEDYSLDLLFTWKNYNKPRVLISLDIISVPWRINRQTYDYKKGLFYHTGDLSKQVSAIVAAIDTNEHKIIRSMTSCIVSKQYRDGWIREEKNIPLLKASGLAQFIDPLEIYLSFEEYFSLEKTASERSESVGLTDKERVVNHGFDVKTSFRGK